ncbi:MAG: enoyl-CoA hydratase [Bryobacterales bacterium]|nr:enoyl-CoA hydratase [Bryobacterales bacterium]
MATSALKIDVAEPLATLTLANPERRNSLSLEVMDALTSAVREIGTSDAVRAVILQAEGPVFSAGHDLREMTGGDIKHYRHVFDRCTEMMTAIQAIPQPVIAQIDGVATAAGCQLVATCDLAVASETSRFATPGVKIGLFCSTPMVALTRSIGRKRALEMLLTGKMIDAAQAAEWGLVNHVVPSDRLAEETHRLAMDIAAASSLTVGLGKQAFYSQIDLDQPKAYDYAKEVMSMNALAADAQEGMCAFLEKRQPVWAGK